MQRKSVKDMFPGIMKSLIRRFIYMVLILAIPLFTPSSEALAYEMVRIDGSSTVYLITEAVAEDFQAFTRGRIRVMVGISGSGGGFKKFCRGETDINDASRPISPVEVKMCKERGIEYIELPVAYDGIAIVVNKKNTWVDYMTVRELRKMWAPESQDRITKWSQIRKGWPDRPFHLYGPGVDSGTYDYFTAAIVGKEHSSRADYTSSEDDNVLVQGIATDPLALGFFGVAYYENNRDKLKLVPVDDENDSNGKGPIYPTFENVMKGRYQPLSRPLFIYVNKKSADRPGVQKFVKFYLTHAAQLAKEVGYIPLPDRAYKLALRRFEKRITGSLFGGHGSQVGVSIEELLKRE